jgi:hypothetical protein
MTDRLHRQINIQLRPIQMVLRRSFHLSDLFDRGRLKPWKLFEREQEFLIPQQDPEAVPGNIRDLSGQSDGAMHLESPSGEPQQHVEHLPIAESSIRRGGDVNGRRQPEFGLTVRMRDMNMNSQLFSGKEEESKGTIANDRRSHETTVADLPLLDQGPAPLARGVFTSGS